MTQQEKILDRVRKLLELSKNNDNVSEAAAAAGQAQKLMSEYAITEAMLEDVETTEVVVNEMFYGEDTSKIASWKSALAMELSQANQCDIYMDMEGGKRFLRIIGKSSKAHTVRYLFVYVVREIERLCAEAAALRGSPGRTWHNNFKLGAAEEVGKRVKAAAEEQKKRMKREAYEGDEMGSGTALVRVNAALARIDAEAAEVEGKMKALGLTTYTSNSRVNREGLEAGRRAGANINLNSGPGLGSGAGRLKE